MYYIHIWEVEFNPRSLEPMEKVITVVVEWWNPWFGWCLGAFFYFMFLEIYDFWNFYFCIENLNQIHGKTPWETNWIAKNIPVCHGMMSIVLSGDLPVVTLLDTLFNVGIMLRYISNDVFFILNASFYCHPLLLGKPYNRELKLQTNMKFLYLCLTIKWSSHITWEKAKRLTLLERRKKTTRKKLTGAGFILLTISIARYTATSTSRSWWSNDFKWRL